jgi:hypothetical protein
MTTNVAVKTQPQIFLSFALADQELAHLVAAELAGAGLAVVQPHQLGAGGEYTDAIRKALRGSAAVVVVIGDISRRHEVAASVLFEIGAAVGAGKPIYVVVDEPSTKLPFNAPNLKVIPVTRLDEVARALIAQH